MVKGQMKELITAFSPGGSHLAILSSNGTVKVWSTSDGSLLAEWKRSGGDPGGRFSCMACSFVGKKHRKERGTFLFALGVDNGDVLAIDVFSGETKWKAAVSFPGGLAGLSFANKGHSLHAVGTNGMASVMNSETGAIMGEFKVSKKPISTIAFSCDEQFLAVANGGRLRVLSLENGKEILKLSNEPDNIQHASISDDANALVTLGSGDKNLQVWWLDKNAGTVSRGPILSMKHAPLSFQCKVGCNGEPGVVVMAVSKSGVTYVWRLKSTLLEEEATPTKITCRVNDDETALQTSGTVKKHRASVIAASLQDYDVTKQIGVLVTYGTVEHPRFSLVDVSNPGEDAIIDALEETKSVPENGVSRKDLHDVDLEATFSPKKSKKASKKRAASDPEHPTSGDVVDIGNGEVADGVLVDDDFNEPTMGENLAKLNLVDSEIAKRNENDEASIAAKPPSADSVHVLLKQALHADDRALLLDCLYTQDEKVIAKSISLLNPSDVLKLLQSLVSIIQSRGAILACALPWLRCLLLQHASGIMSQESSLVALNSLYQLIESRVSTFQSAIQLSSVFDVLYAGIVDDEGDESDAIVPVIIEDKDESDEEESEDAMETEENSEDDEASDEAFGGLSDLEGDDGMSE